MSKTNLPNCYRCQKQPCECKDGITLYHGDCREILPGLGAGSVDMLITDPPYGARRPSARRLAGEQFSEIIDNDCVRTDWMHYRCIKQGGAIYCFCTWDTLEQWKSGLSGAGFRVRSCIVWDKVIHGLADLKTCWAPQHELVLFGALGRHELQGGRPKDVLRVQRVNSTRLQHPYEKPVQLIESLLLPSSERGDTILDPFAGSGTTGRACKDLGRKCIMIELEEKYCEIASNRLKQEVLF